MTPEEMRVSNFAARPGAQSTASVSSPSSGAEAVSETPHSSIVTISSMPRFPPSRRTMGKIATYD